MIKSYDRHGNRREFLKGAALSTSTLFAGIPFMSQPEAVAQISSADGLAASVAGHCDPRFSPVRAAFEANFASRGEVGAAFCVMLDGEPVVDLVGGWRDAAKRLPWTTDSVVNVWSTTKGVQATCFAMAVDRGLARYDQPVADFWPEFAAQGKEKITIGMLLSHQAGLCGFTSPATLETLLGGEASAALLAEQAPIWEPGTASGYHGITIGILGTELFRRIEGRPIRQFVEEEFRQVRGLDIMVGLPISEEGRRAEIIPPPIGSVLPSMTPPQVAALANPPLHGGVANERAWRAADLPSANGHSNARALAGLYSLLVHSELIRPEVLAEAIQPRVRDDNVDLVLAIPTRWAAGYLANTGGCYGPSASSFGHSGWGGAFAFGDPEKGLAVSYTMNRMGSTLREDSRNLALIEATYDCL
jgi:CubicO group peptidase (beta-lactamase class C family)